MAAGLRPDPLGKLKRSPDHLAALWGPTSKGRSESGGNGRGKGEEGGRKWKGRREVKGKGGGEEGEGGYWTSSQMSGYGAAQVENA